VLWRQASCTLPHEFWRVLSFLWAEWRWSPLCLEDVPFPELIRKNAAA